MMDTTASLHHAPATHETFERHGKSDNILFVDSKEVDPGRPLRLHHLVKAPRIRQWISQGKLYREIGMHESSSLELWFDLVFASIVHFLADGATEELTGLNLARFILTFYASFSIWADIRGFLNTSGTDDWLQRIYILIVVLLLSGFTSNASAIKIEDISADGEVSSEDSPSPSALFSTRDIIFTEDSQTAIKTAFAMISLLFAIRAIRFAVYGLWLPRFRTYFTVMTIISVMIWALWFPPVYVHTVNAVFGFPTAGLLFEVAFQLSTVVLVVTTRGAMKEGHKGQAVNVPAVNLEHHIERHSAFIVIVLGEVVISSGFLALNGQAGVHAEYGRSALSIITSFLIAILYFNEGNCRRFVHALRRHVATGRIHTLAHFPLAASIVLMAGCLKYLLPNDDVSQTLVWFYSGSMAVIVLTITVLGSMHRVLDDPRADLIPRNIRMAMRIAVVIIFALTPLHNRLDSTSILAVHAGLLGFLVIFDIVGSIGSRLQRQEEAAMEKQAGEEDKDQVEEIQPTVNVETDM